jgi:LuxR family maltose regulon positive regulatory protein
MTGLTDKLPRAHREQREPVAGRGLVARGGLFDRLSPTAAGRVILVCAPAGSGKTVLLRSWVEATWPPDRVAWVSVERGERDDQRFGRAVTNALAGADELVERVEPAPTLRSDGVVARLLGDLALLDAPALLVIDDLHELRSDSALAALERLIERSPPELHVALATREDPQLGLHRLRLAGELTELRADDLRFSIEETREFLRAAGIELSDAGVSLLYERTEGWAAGLRLAAISLARHPDPERFITEFSGSERTVAGYLLAEVLERQPPEVRELLLRTSILERVSGPLADHLTGGAGSERILHQLEDANAFVTSLDAGRTWFRYHHLFADLLRLELRRASPAMVAPLHRAAAEWHAEFGDVLEAIRHAQAARDWVLASRLLADNHLDLTLDGRTEVVRQLVSAFPSDVAANDAELALVFATVRLLEGALDESAADVDLAERLGELVPPDRKRRFDALRAVLRLTVARWRSDFDTVVDAMRSLEALRAAQPSGDRAVGDELRAVALQNLGVAELWSWRPDDGRRDLENAVALARRAGRPWLEISALGHLAIAGPWTGMTLSEGAELADEAVGIADRNGWSQDPIVVTALGAGAMCLMWLGRFDEADRRLERAEGTLQPDGEPGTELIVRDVRGLLRLTQGRFEEARAEFGAARRMQRLLSGTHPLARAARAREMRLRARLEGPAAAVAALGDVDEEERDTAEVRMAEAVIRLAAGDPERAIDALAPVIEGVAPMIHCPSAMTEAQLLDAVATEQLGSRRGAEESLERALELAEPEGIVLPFVLVPVRDILERVDPHRTAHATLRQTVLDVLAGASPQRTRDAVAPLEELSEAEVRVVRYLPSNLRAPEIAAELFLSTNTIRTHLRHIYAKLGAHGRAEAVARARELGLLAPSLRRR